MPTRGTREVGTLSHFGRTPPRTPASTSIPECGPGPQSLRVFPWGCRGMGSRVGSLKACHLSAEPQPALIVPTARGHPAGVDMFSLKWIVLAFWKLPPKYSHTVCCICSLIPSLANHYSIQLLELKPVPGKGRWDEPKTPSLPSRRV